MPFSIRKRFSDFVPAAGASFALALFALLFAPSSAAAADEKSSQRPHVVMILVDDMGYGDPGCFNAESRIQTPNIDRLASQGMKFTDAHASGPLCHVSRYGLMTGQYPFRAHPNQWAKKATIDVDRRTIAHVMHDAGYQTSMVGKWHLGFDEQGYDRPMPGGPVDRGFDTFFGIRASTDIPPYFYIQDRMAVQPPTVDILANSTEGWTPIQGEFWRSGKISSDLKLHDVLPRFTNEAIKVIDGAAKKSDSPLFLYLAYPAPHTPWLPSAEFQGRSKVSMYGDFVMMVDSEIGRILSRLKDRQMADDTVVIFSSDNGPVWYPDDVRKYGHNSVANLRGMKADAWEGGHRMPFIVRWPFNVEPNSVCEDLISFVDVFATLAELTGQKLNPNDAPDSFSFLPALTRTGSASRTELAVQAGGKMTAFRMGAMKLINGLGSGGFSKPRRIVAEKGEPAMQLYDLAADRSETRNLAAELPDTVSKLNARLQAVLAEPSHRLMDQR